MARESFFQLHIIAQGRATPTKGWNLDQNRKEHWPAWSKALALEPDQQPVLSLSWPAWLARPEMGSVSPKACSFREWESFTLRNRCKKESTLKEIVASFLRLHWENKPGQINVEHQVESVNSVTITTTE